MTEVRPKNQPLSLTQMYQGFMKALEQAVHLADESQILADNKFFAGALSKTILGLEEVGKNRLILYQAGTLMMGLERPWKYFWSTYRSHTAKLEMAMKWATILDPQLLSEDDVNAHLKFISEEAGRLDKRKQESQYVGFDGKEFNIPKDEGLKDEATAMIAVLKSLCIRLRHQYQENLPEDEFLELLSTKIRLSRALKLIDEDIEHLPDDWAKAVADGNSPILLKNGELPTEETFKKRVAERYEIVPSRIQVTLKHLNNSAIFEEFYNSSLKSKYGYPDWVILSTIFNISLNARISHNAKEFSDPDNISRYMDWAEKSDEEPLNVELFTNEDSFNFALDLWLAAFLVGLGVAIPDLTAKNTQKIRRVASRYYSVFEYDIEHWPMFHFCGEQAYE